MEIILNIIILFLIFIFLIFFIFIYVFTFSNKNLKKKSDEWNIISSDFYYYFDGYKKDNYYFKREIPTFYQSLVSSKVFYSFLSRTSKKEIELKIEKLIKKNELIKIDEPIEFFLEIESKKIKCYLKFFAIDKKYKILKGTISNFKIIK